ncbi:MAG: nucleotidyltransferase domain-containing protein [Myxococcota bacterium]|nr:nucleotidyltransferase domain-containing protein [Myxococcota bacterium]
MSSTPGSDTQAFARLVDALDPFLDQLVFIGGWGHRLMALHPSAIPPRHELLMTEDVDIATPERLSSKAGSILGRLEEAGFSEELSSEFEPPISQYTLPGSGSGLYAEFLAPLLGAETRRDGTPNATVSIAGVSAQKLRHLDLLFEGPWSVTISRKNGFHNLDKPTILRIPNPISFVVQKLLVMPKRARRQDRAKDVLYTYDTLALFVGATDALLASWRLLSPRIDKRSKSKLTLQIDKLFRVPSDDVREAAEVARATGRANPPTANQIAAACRGRLLEILPET